MSGPINGGGQNDEWIQRMEQMRDALFPSFNSEMHDQARLLAERIKPPAYINDLMARISAPLSESDSARAFRETLERQTKQMESMNRLLGNQSFADYLKTVEKLYRNDSLSGYDAYLQPYGPSPSVKAYMESLQKHADQWTSASKLVDSWINNREQALDLLANSVSAERARMQALREAQKAKHDALKIQEFTVAREAALTHSQSISDKLDRAVSLAANIGTAHHDSQLSSLQQRLEYATESLCILGDVEGDTLTATTLECAEAWYALKLIEKELYYVQHHGDSLFMRLLR